MTSKMAEARQIESKVTENEDSNKDEASFLFLSYLDEVSDRVENLRHRALELIQERDTLLTVISQLKGDVASEATVSVSLDESYDLQTSLERLTKRCAAVDINVHTVRNSEQEQVMSKVDLLIAKLERACIFDAEADQTVADSTSYRDKAKSLLNACLSESICGSDTPVDYKFQSLILGCALDDQKMVRKRLECLVNGRCHEEFVELHIRQEQISGEAGTPSTSETVEFNQSIKSEACKS